jgi:hypothetical protein
MSSTSPLGLLDAAYVNKTSVPPIDNPAWIADTLQALKAGYNRKDATVALIGGVTKFTQFAAEWGPFFAQDIYDPAVYDPADRERVIIAHFSATSQMYPMAIHIWWGMVEGLPFNDVTRTFLITGSYAGIWSFTQSCGLFQEWVAFMAALWVGCKAAGASDVPWLVALTAMNLRFNQGKAGAVAVAEAVAFGIQQKLIP